MEVATLLGSTVLNPDRGSRLNVLALSANRKGKPIASSETVLDHGNRMNVIPSKVTQPKDNHFFNLCKLMVSPI